VSHKRNVKKERAGPCNGRQKKTPGKKNSLRFVEERGWIYALWEAKEDRAEPDVGWPQDVPIVRGEMFTKEKKRDSSLATTEGDHTCG